MKNIYSIQLQTKISTDKVGLDLGQVMPVMTISS